MHNSEKRNDRAFQYYPALRKIELYINENYSEEVSLKKAAQIAGLERKYFSTFFHKKVGIPFRQWLMHTRIKKAIRFLEIEDSSITQIAFAVGYQDLRTFERAFKKCTGNTPREFKKTIEFQMGFQKTGSLTDL